MTKTRSTLVRGAWVLVLLALVAVPATARKHKKKATQTASAAPGPYVLAPGDVLDIQVWKEPQITREDIPVRPDGKISVPLINDVQAAGLTAAALTQNITAGLKKYIDDPQVTVIVSQVNSQRVFVMGEVNHGGEFPLAPDMTVLQGLSSAGGFTVFANTRKIYVLRQENGKQVKHPFNYNAVVKGKKTEENIALKPGDTIVVP